MTRIIGIASGKGGVGKTTVTVNLGAALARELKKDVIIVDCNVTTSHLGLHLGMYTFPTTLNDVLRGKARIESAIYEHFSGVRIIPASLFLEDLKGVDVVKIKSTIKKLEGMADYILLDSAPGLGREAMAALDACDEIIFVTTPYVPSLTDIAKSQTIAEDKGIKIIGVVLNMLTGEKHEPTQNEVEAIIKLPVLARIPFDKKILRSLSAKSPVVMAYPSSEPSREFIKVAEFVTGERAPRRGIFDRLRDLVFGSPEFG